MFTSVSMPGMTVVLIPVMAVIIAMIIPLRYFRPAMLTAQVFQLIAATTMLYGLNTGLDGFQWVSEWHWSEELNLHFSLGADGLSAPFIFINACVMLSISLSGGDSRASYPRLSQSLFLLLQGLINGVYLAIDLGTFFLCWELVAIPVVLILMCQNPTVRVRHAATRYALFMLLGGLPLLMAIMLLAATPYSATDLSLMAPVSFDYLTLLEHHLPSSIEARVFPLLLLAFLIKIPIVPLHGWLPSLAMEGSAGVTAMVTGFKLGLYGVLRFLLPLASHESLALSQWVMAIGLVSALYAALAGLKQSNMRSVLGYLSMSHAGLVLTSFFALNPWAVDGAFLQLIHFSCCSSGLFLLAGYLYQRAGTLELIQLGGMATLLPGLHGLFVFMMASMIAIPGTLGFPAEWLMLAGIFKAHTGYGILATLIGLLNIVCMLRIYRRVFQGKLHLPSHIVMEDVRPREWWVLLPLLLILLSGGLYPSYLLDYGQGVTHHIIDKVNESGTQGNATSYALINFP